MKYNDIPNMISKDVLGAFLRMPNVPDLPADKEVSLAAIDVGYGFTKYISGFYEDGQPVCGLFPSIAALSPMDNLTGGFFVSRDTKKIEHGGTVWEVGPDVFDITTKNEVRALHDDFVKSEQWKILFYGALAYMGVTNIDYLVLGLPVSQMAKEAEVVKLAKGEHIIDGETYTVKNVLVIPQPLGALYNYALRGGDFHRFMQTNTLVIDPGYLTFDFLMTKGFSVNAHRSGARPGSMSAILGAIANSIGRELGINYDDFNQIDSALGMHNYAGPSDSRTIWINGNQVSLNPHLASTIPVIETNLNFMLNKLQDTRDIAQIVMAGGPNRIFEKTIRKQFPSHELHTIEDGIFGNVIGFMLWGMMVAYGNGLKKK